MFCAVLAWSRFRFVRFAAGEKAATTLGLLAECFEVLGGVPKTVLADRMGCLKAGVVAKVVVPAAEYVRFATHYGFRPDFCEAADSESNSLAERLAGTLRRECLDHVADPRRNSSPSVLRPSTLSTATATVRTGLQQESPRRQPSHAVGITVLTGHGQIFAA